MLESKWGLRFIAFLLALFFFLSVNNVFGNIFNTGNLGQKSSKTIQDVPVEILYNTKDLHLTKAPETVNVTISGPQSKIIKIENPEDLRVVIDLSNAKLPFCLTFTLTFLLKGSTLTCKFTSLG
ncbi:hypothetical protein APW32_12745 [Staphylococcus aureus]|nr:hypothetical protein APW32_12745 [Staphylococcus aureus]